MGKDKPHGQVSRQLKLGNDGLKIVTAGAQAV